MRNYAFLSMLFVAALTGTIGCIPDEDNVDWQTSASMVETFGLFDDVERVLHYELERIPSITNTTAATAANCGTYTLVTAGGGATYPATITFDFGSGCTSTIDNRIRSGKIIAVLSKAYHSEGSSLSVSFDNYKVNTYALQGTMSFNSVNAENIIYQITNGMAISPAGDTALLTANLTANWQEGTATTFVTNGDTGTLDDVLALTGSLNGTASNGSEYKSATTTSIRKFRTCRWVTGGSITLDPVGETLPQIITFGSEENCDNEANVTSTGALFTTVYMK
jgi:hypothetical protein